MNEKISTFKSRFQEISSQLDRLKAELSNLEKIQRELADFDKVSEFKRHQLQMKIQERDTVFKGLTTLYEGKKDTLFRPNELSENEEQLRKILASQHDLKAKQHNIIAVIQQKLNSARKSLQQCQEESSFISKVQGKLEILTQADYEAKAACLAAINGLCAKERELQVSVEKTSAWESISSQLPHLNAYASKLRNELNQKKTELKLFEAHMKKEIESTTNSLNSTKVKLSSTNESIFSKQKDIELLSASILSIRKQISETSNLEGAIKSLESELDSAQKELQDTESLTELKILQDRRSLLSKDFERLFKERNDLSDHLARSSEMEALIINHKQNKEKFDISLNNFKSALEMQEFESLDQVYVTIREQVFSDSEKFNSLLKTKSSLDSERGSLAERKTNLQESSATLASRRNSLELALKSLGLQHITDFDKEIAQVSLKIRVLKECMNRTTASVDMLEEALKFAREEQKCHLCVRKFKKADLDIFLSTNEHKLQMIQEGTYDDTKNELVQSESWMVSLQEGKDLRQEILDIENAKLPLNDKQIKVLRDRQRSLDVEYEDILVQEQNLSESLRNLRSLLQHCSQLMDFEKDVLSQNRKLSEFENNISIQDLKSQIEVVNSRMFVVESESTELSEQISALTERRIHKQNEIANLRNLLQSKREEGLKMNALQSQLSDLENKKSLFSKELQEKQDFLEIVSSQLARNSMESRRLDSALDMKRKEMNEFILSLDDRVQFFESSAKSIQSSISEAQDRSKQISTLRSQTSGVSVRFIYLSSFDFIRLLKTVLMTFSRKFLCLSLK